MVELSKLKHITRIGLKLLRAKPGIIEGLVYASANRRSVSRLVYTSHIPCNGLEEPKSDEDLGISVEVWINKNGRRLVGIGHEPNDLSLSAVKKALAKAVRDAVADPDFQGFYKPTSFAPNKLAKLTNLRVRLLPPEATPSAARGLPGAIAMGDGERANFANKLMGAKPAVNLTDSQEAKLLSKMGWDTIAGALDGLKPYLENHKLSPAAAAFILNGDNFILRERMALATTNGVADSDESTVILSFITAMLETQNAKGSAWGALGLGGDLSGYDTGRRAALAAINNVGGVRVKTGSYNVVFGPQAVTELFGNLLLPNLNLGLVDFGASIFTGKYGQTVASPLLTLIDDATIPGGAGSKRVTCEGCPTGKTILIDQGKLVGFLADSRTANKVLAKSQDAAAKIGVDPHEIRHAISPRNGFRFWEGGGRVAAGPVGIHATNLIIESPRPKTEDELLSSVKNGLYIGRLWYTYPVGGLSTGIISGTAIADCYTIKDGKLSQPILPNTLRLEDNLNQMIKNIVGIGSNQVPTILWASDEITHAPWVAITNVNFRQINHSPHLKNLPRI
ncbi:MAG: hypothetical protein UW60_C0044G0010 [Candidatus Woesebacteria bacterium GW2011_GWA2_44_33]|uniref:Metalloprotease TldD/E C-terminal domain-containing protein n=1 Tax=Candidatus Woesebacteria bacterium GW2011_GWA2_44_33 TaxID=1618564 RepID=A0A0G1J1M9_9BACT|nr:MAG: hypothetical protein UW60_C0044G0010 [Candidatus Woesebacteria bacterium GW2011_GWA2_44_33]